MADEPEEEEIIEISEDFRDRIWRSDPTSQPPLPDDPEPNTTDEADETDEDFRGRVWRILRFRIFR
jgi:hypothetical protein